VAWRPCVALRQAEIANEGAAFFVKRELQMHSLGIVRSAGKAVVLGWRLLWRLVAVRLAGHGEIVAWMSIHNEDSPKT